MMLLNKKNILFKILLFITFLSLNYSTSYQQFRHFDVSSNRGLTDQISYRSMSDGDFNVSHNHRYRFLIPKSVSLLKPYSGFIKSPKAVENRDVEATKILFFIFNCFISTITAYILFYYLLSLNLNLIGSLLGSIVFITSRTTIINNGVPMIDSGQNLAVIIICSSILNNKINQLSILSPLLILTKETVFPLFFIPFTKRSFFSLKYIFSLFISILTFFLTRRFIDNLALQENVDLMSSGNIFEILLLHMQKYLINLKQILSLKGIHNLIFPTYAFLYIFGLIGFLNNKRDNTLKLPISIKIILPYTIILGFISGDMGRMTFMSFPVIIPYISYGFSSVFDNYFLKKVN